MTLDEITRLAIDPAFALLPVQMDSIKARVLMLTIGLQESKFRSRWQVLANGKKGRARSFWQMEREGGVRGTMRHAASQAHLRALCDGQGVSYEPMAVWRAIEKNDVLAAGLARLLLWTDAKPLPELGDVDGAWRYYLRLWQPGKPHLKTWPAYYAKALTFVTGV